METRLHSPAISDELRTWLKGYFDGLYAASGHDHAGVYSLISHNHSGVYAPASHGHNSRQVIYHHMNSTAIGPGGTMYVTPSIPGLSGLNGLTWPIAGNFKNMALRINSTQPASGRLIVTLMKNLVDTSLQIIVPANSVAGTNFFNNTNVAAFNALDLLTIKFYNEASANSTLITSFTVIFEAATT